MGLILDISPRMLEKVSVLCYCTLLPTRAMYANCKKSRCSTEKEYRDMREKYEDDFEAGMGAEAIRTLLEEIDLGTDLLQN